MRHTPWAIPCLLVSTLALAAAPAPAEPAPQASLVRVFRKAVGRDPGADELAALRGKTYDQAVEATLASRQFQEEGFYAYLRDRLVLSRDGTRRSLANSYTDYCALRLELAEAAVQDDAGADGHWATLRYRARWLALPRYSSFAGCFVGADVDALIAAYDEVPRRPGEEPPFDPRMQKARACVSSLKSYFPGPDAGAGQLGKLKRLMTTLKALPAAARRQSLLDAVPEGEALLLALVNPSPSGENPVRPLGDVALERRDGRVVIVQELGEAGGGGCDFAAVDPATHGQRGAVPAAQVFPAVRRPALGTRYQGLIRPDAADASRPAVNVPGANGALYVRITTKEAAGVHASPFWLSTHRSTVNNQHLHRARLVYHSYFCADVNPDAATNDGETPVVHEELEPYFAPDDVHKNGSANCYNCHALVQPLANFFGRFSYGVDYETTQGSGAYLATGGGFARPGGLWEGDRFFPSSGADLEGLDDLLTKHPGVRGCIARKTWERLVGDAYPLTDAERVAAVQAFGGGGGGGRASLAELLRHYLRESPRGRAYGIGGGRALDDLSPPPDAPCAEVPDDAQVADAHATMSRTCGRCHVPGRISPAFLAADGAFAPAAPDAMQLGALWHDLYCNVRTGRMPLPTSPIQPTPAERASLGCVLRRGRNELARAGDIPAAYFERECEARPFRREGHP